MLSPGWTRDGVCSSSSRCCCHGSLTLFLPVCN